MLCTFLIVFSDCKTVAVDRATTIHALSCNSMNVEKLKLRISGCYIAMSQECKKK